MPVASNDIESGETTARATPTDLAVPAWLRRAVMIALAVMYLGCVNSQWRVTNDSALYLLLSESLVQGEGYTLCGRPHVHAPPLFPVWLAMLSRLGLGEMIWLNLSMILMAFAGLWATDRLLRDQTTPHLALLALMMVGFSAEMLRLGTSQLSDIPFMALISFGLWNYVRGLRGGAGRLEMGTLSLIACGWLRIVGIPLALSAAVGLVFQKRDVSARRVWGNAIALAMGAVATLGVFAYWHHIHKGSLPSASYAHHLETLSGRAWGAWLLQPFQNLLHTGPQYSRLLSGQEFPEALALLVFTVPTLVGAWCFARRREWLGLITTAGYLGSIVCLRPILARYLFPVSPFLVLYFLEGIRFLAEKSPRLRGREVRLVFTAAIVLIAANLPKNLLRAYQAHQPNFQDLTTHGWSDLRAATDFLSANAQPGDKFVSNEAARPLAYLSRVPFLDLAKPVLRQPMTDDSIQTFSEQNGIRFVVFRTTKNRWPLFQSLRRACQNSETWFPVFSSETYEVFERRRVTDSHGPIAVQDATPSAQWQRP